MLQVNVVLYQNLNLKYDYFAMPDVCLSKMRTFSTYLT